MPMTIPKKMFSYSTKFLFDPIIIISYTGEIFDKPLQKTGFISLKDNTEEESIQVASVENMINTNFGNLLVVKCNKYGEEVQGITLKEVTLNPAENFSLFNLTKRHK